MADAVSYTWPVLLDPPGAVDVGGNSYRLPSGTIVPRNILTTVSHVGILPDDGRYGPGASIYSDGTIRRPDLTVLEDLRLSGQRITLGTWDGKTVTTNDTPRNADGTPFQWGRTAAMQAAGIAPAVADAYAKGGVDILTSPVPINSGNPITFGPYKGLFPDAQGGTTLVDSAGIVRVRNFVYADYFRLYSPVQYDAGGMEITPTNGNAGYRSGPTAPVVANMIAVVADDGATYGTSPTFSEGIPTGGMPKIIVPPSPNLASGGRDRAGEPVLPMTNAATTTTPAKPTSWWMIGAAVLALIVLSKRGR